MRIDNVALENLAAAFFSKAGKDREDRLSLTDFTTVLQTRAEVRESLQFGNLDARATRDVRKDVESLSFVERTQSKMLMAAQVRLCRYCRLSSSYALPNLVGTGDAVGPERGLVPSCTARAISNMTKLDTESNKSLPSLINKCTDVIDVLLAIFTSRANL